MLEGTKVVDGLAGTRSTAVGGRTLASLAVVAGLLLVPGLVRADAVYTLVPTLGVGVATNPTATGGVVPPGARDRDEFGNAALNARAIFDNGPQSSNVGIGYRLSYQRYLHDDTVPETFANELSVTSALHPTVTTNLDLGATATLSRLSQVVAVGTVANVTPQALAAGDSYFFSTGANEILTYQPLPTRTLVQNLVLNRVQYLSDTPQPSTLSVTATLRGDLQAGRDTYSAETEFIDSYRGSSSVMTTVLPGGHLFLVGARAAWRREFSATWSTDAEAGAVSAFRPSGGFDVQPVGLASVNYRRVPWFANLTASQTAAPNIFIGGISLNDQAVLRLGLPLNRRDTIVLAGFAGITHSKFLGSNSGDTPPPTYNQIAAGASLTAHPDRSPFWAGIEYALVDQLAGDATNTMTAVPVVGFLRQTLMVLVGGTFVWGKGVPSPFRGVL
ncbi:MAG TPA: hypothetical protein VHU40_18125 [Polyangia bacterium]|jgi:hypothetical protein|nr:hypothetical protein [Polyangia bacterium]